ncbi:MULTISPECIES: RNA polymerase sigma factor [Polyangium]|uniref:Sigma-70 family RNA polymerase sigma factor n=1 Tax=Polyangium sorediatum TaxID=889274 RepID=A0ABT6NM65_9BACT|nr:MULTISPECIES: sigma-70 family RNA polymerase sigma factor [Polyangium]MDI1429391.1 sigma-70 family RNA polymerase sigma factor [Polyangium sorediatum]
MSWSWFESATWFAGAAGEDASTPAPELAAVHARHAEFVFACLQRLGVRGAALEDAHQEVFLVVHRRLASYDGRASMTAWLFGICRRVAAAHRRRAHVRHEIPVDPEWDIEDIDADPEQALARGQERREVERVLDMLDLDKRAVLVMYEIEGIECDRIAVLLGIPVGTVYSRLHAARRDFEKAMTRAAARAAGGKAGRR